LVECGVEILHQEDFVTVKLRPQMERDHLYGNFLLISYLGVSKYLPVLKTHDKCATPLHERLSMPTFPA
jgi:hypothetical protein